MPPESASQKLKIYEENTNCAARDDFIVNGGSK